MSRYGGTIYHGGTYGETPRLAYSAEPMSIQVVNFYESYVGWQSPTGSFSKFRLVRNQNGFPETAEDGEIVFEYASSDGSSIEGLVPQSSFKDGEENPDSIKPIAGRQVYYRIFLFTDAKYWVVAGSITDVLPENTDAITKMMNLLPRVYTSKELSPLGVIDPESVMYKFMDALAFTYEQMLTQIKLVRPQYTIDSALYSPIPTEDSSLGLPVEYNLPVANQRRLIREAIYLYSQRGLKTGLENFAESLTGYAPTATVSSNLLLTIQDSTFYGDVGNWVATNGTISSSKDYTTLDTAGVIDLTDSCKIVASSAGSMTLGASDVINKGIPVISSTQYTVSCSLRSPTSDGNVSISVRFYDGTGAPTSAIHTSSAVAANNTWKTASVTATSDATSCYAIITINWSAAGTFYVDEVCAQLGASRVYDEARTITLQMDAKKLNYVPNPSFETGSTGWTVTGATFSQSTDVPSDGYSGSHSGKFVAAGSWTISINEQLTVEPGNYFTLSMYTKSPTMTSMIMSMDIYDSTDTLITTYTDSHMIGTDWMRGSITGLVNSDWDASYAKVHFTGTAGTLYMDMVQAEDSYRPTDYIDGSMPEQFGVEWAGTAHASRSLLYPSKTIKMPKLAYSMDEWVPMNAWWRITTPAGVEYTNLSVV